jgi:hypothetical protein
MKNYSKLISENDKKSILEMHNSFKKQLNEQLSVSTGGVGIPPKVKTTIDLLKKLGYKEKSKNLYVKKSADGTMSIQAKVDPFGVQLVFADQAEFFWDDQMQMNNPKDFLKIGHGSPNMETMIKNFEKSHGMQSQSKPSIPKKPSQKPKQKFVYSETTNTSKVWAEADIVKLVKKVLKEEILKEDEPEPVLQGAQSSGFFLYDEGKSVPKSLNRTPFNTALRDRIVERMSRTLSRSVSTLRTFMNNPKFNIPAFVEIKVGTSSTGTPEANVNVSEGRADYLRRMVFDAFLKLNIRPDVAQKFIVDNTNAKYIPSNLDASFYDARIVPPKPGERFGEIVIKDLTTEGNELSRTVSTLSKLNSSDIDGLWEYLWNGDNVDEQAILRAFNSGGPRVYSDIQDLDNLFRGQNTTLESWLNSKLGSEDYKEKNQISNMLDMAARKSGCQRNTVRMVGDRISIDLRATCNQKDVGYEGEG